MLEDKVRDVFADMVVLKNPERTEFFSNLSLPSYMRDWLVMKFSDDDGIIDYDSVLRYIRQYIPSREDFEQFKLKNIELKEKIEKGKLTQEEYMEWLEKQ